MTQQWGQVLAVGLAGAAGTLCRYGITQCSQAICGTHFPWGTFFVNILGCFSFGGLAMLFAAEQIPVAWKAVLLTGFLGGFTTFSAFAFDNQQLLAERAWLPLAVNLLGQNALGIAAVLLGMRCAACWISGEL